MIPPTDELKGFALLKNPSKETILLSIGSVVQINKAGLSAIGDPVYVNLFFDAFGKRMMVKKAKKGEENVFRVTENAGLTNYGLIKTTILQIIEKDKFPGQTVVSYLGHKVKDTDCLIFDLGTVHMMRDIRKITRSTAKDEH